jgi:hypothetical protein
MCRCVERERGREVGVLPTETNELHPRSDESKNDDDEEDGGRGGVNGTN